MAGQDGSPFADVVRADGLFDEIGRRKVAWHGIEFIGRKKCSGTAGPWQRPRDRLHPA